VARWSSRIGEGRSWAPPSQRASWHGCPSWRGGRRRVCDRPVGLGRRARAVRASAVRLTAAAAVVTGAPRGSTAAYLEHYKSSFGNKWMWSPIVLTPPLVVAGIGGVFSRRCAKTALPLTAGLYVANGLLGEYFHARGVARKPGGWRLYSYNLPMASRSPRQHDGDGRRHGSGPADHRGSRPDRAGEEQLRALGGRLDGPLRRLHARFHPAICPPIPTTAWARTGRSSTKACARTTSRWRSSYRWQVRTGGGATRTATRFPASGVRRRRQASRGCIAMRDRTRFAHLIGGARMGSSPEHSVVNANQRAWAAPNLFLADGSVCPTQGSARCHGLGPD
jgi:choline dehydrogenase-like flavoprotein